mgnify:CR=1 FL=1
MPKIIKIAADSIESLRNDDVYRVLSESNANLRATVAEYILTHRADLATEVLECMEDIAA